MMFDYEKEGETFMAELQSGKFSIERISNTAEKYRDKETRDEVAFNEYLQSEAFKALDDEVSKS